MSIPITKLTAIEETRAFVRQEQAAGRRVAVVPTMGALHEGHLRLVDRAHELADVVVATIFVNPTQFAPHEDLDRYPRTLEMDLEKLAARKVQAAFCPLPETMYPSGFSTYVQPPSVADRWEGEFRPGFFRGVATIVLKLFQIVPADVAVFGQKDYQQACVVRTMVRDLNLATRVETIPIVREPDGLAMSSRNVYLSDKERTTALGLSKALKVVRESVAAGETDVEKLDEQLVFTLGESGVDSIDYAVVVDADTLAPIDRLDRAAVALIAVHVGSTRLIDNELLDPAIGNS